MIVAWTSNLFKMCSTLHQIMSAVCGIVTTHLLEGTLNSHTQTWLQGKQPCIQEVLVGDAILLKAVQERRGCLRKLRLPHNYYTLELLVHTGWLVVAANCNISIEPWLLHTVWVVNASKVLVK